MVLRPRSADVTGRAAEVRVWLAAGGPTMDPAELLLCLAEAWAGTPRATGRRARPHDREVSAG
jgi:hypothetical protein